MLNSPTATYRPRLILSVKILQTNRHGRWHLQKERPKKPDQKRQGGIIKFHTDLLKSPACNGQYYSGSFVKAKNCWYFLFFRRLPQVIFTQRRDRLRK